MAQATDLIQKEAEKLEKKSKVSEAKKTKTEKEAKPKTSKKTVTKKKTDKAKTVVKAKIKKEKPTEAGTPKKAVAKKKVAVKKTVKASAKDSKSKTEKPKKTKEISLSDSEKKEEIVEEKTEKKEPAKKAKKKTVADKTKNKKTKKTKEVTPADSEKIVKNIDKKVKKAEVVKEETEPEVQEENYHTFSKEQLIELLEELVKNEEIYPHKTKIALIKVAYYKQLKESKEENLKTFLSEGGVKEDYIETEDPLDERYKISFDIYKVKNAKYLQEQELKKQENLKTKQKILEELKVLINSEETLKKTYDEFKTIQDKWKEIGMVPKGEVNTLWQNYHFLVEKFFDRVKINKELRDLDLKKNLESKIILCEKAEKLLLEKSITKSFKQLQKYHEEWKEIGPVQQDIKDEIWERFKITTSKINQRRREYYEKINEDQVNNLNAKIALCEKTEEIVNAENQEIKKWVENTNQVNDLLKVWKTIGPAPKAHNDEIWKRFKTSINTFYTNKKEFFSVIKDEQTNNYNIKLNICVEAEALKTNTNWRQTTDSLIKLQHEWKKVGQVPRRYSDKIWKRFRAACDEFFNNKADYFANIDVHEKNNLDTKLKLIEKVEKFEFTEDKNKNLEIISNFQREWTEIGHIPIKEKHKIQIQFRQAIDKQLSKLEISDVEISTINYKAKFESTKDSPEARKIISQERYFISNKITKLKSNLSLWENNIGFFANSPKANEVIKDFEKKIEKAKNDLIVFKAKLKYLNSQ